MKEDEDDQPTCSAGAGGASSAGQPYSPSDEGEDAGAPSHSGPPKAVPVGRPVSEEEYSRRKERARDEDRPAGSPAAQEDPARRGRDG